MLVEPIPQIFHNHNCLRQIAIFMALILGIPLPPERLIELEQQATLHDLGYKYLYLADISLFQWGLFEACLFWIPLRGKTGSHDHQGAINRGRVIRGTIIEETSRVTRSQIKLIRQRKIPAGGWRKSSFRTAPYQIHELVGASEENAIALSLYFPKRDY